MPSNQYTYYTHTYIHSFWARLRRKFDVHIQTLNRKYFSIQFHRFIRFVLCIHCIPEHISGGVAHPHPFFAIRMDASVCVCGCLCAEVYPAPIFSFTTHPILCEFLTYLWRRMGGKSVYLDAGVGGEVRCDERIHIQYIVHSQWESRVQTTFAQSLVRTNTWRIVFESISVFAANHDESIRVCNTHATLCLSLSLSRHMQPSRMTVFYVCMCVQGECGGEQKTKITLSICNWPNE